MLVQMKSLLRPYFKSDKYFYNFTIIFWSLESAMDNDFCSIAPSAL